MAYSCVISPNIVADKFTRLFNKPSSQDLGTTKLQNYASQLRSLILQSKTIQGKTEVCKMIVYTEQIPYTIRSAYIKKLEGASYTISSIKPLTRKCILKDMITRPFNGMLLKEAIVEAHTCSERSKKSDNTSFQQVQEVRSILETMFGIENIFISKGGSTDKKICQCHPGVDGTITYNGNIIYIYLRNGTNNGGEQGSRATSNIAAPLLHPDFLFLFISDGLETALRWSYYENRLGKLSNAMLMTSKMLPFVDKSWLINRSLTYTEKLSLLKTKLNI